MALAVCYNDLKGLFTWAEQHPTSDTSSSAEISASRGEQVGFEIQRSRLAAGHLHELLKLLKEYEAVGRSERMRKIMKKAERSVREEWDDLLAIATETGNGRNASFATTLLLVRNNASFHYYQPRTLIAGFREFFFNAPPKPENEVAYASVGRNMAQTRFYFADAAMQASLELLTERQMDQKKFVKRFRKTIDGVNRILVHIVTESIRQAKIPA